MQLNVKSLSYLTQVLAALQDPMSSVHAVTTPICPECGEIPLLHDYSHVTWAPEGDKYTRVVVVACEGYWVISPRMIGHDNDNWMDWRDDS